LDCIGLDLGIGLWRVGDGIWDLDEMGWDRGVFGDGDGDGDGLEREGGVKYRGWGGTFSGRVKLFGFRAWSSERWGV
jgi:hypothetical protein